MRISSQAFFLVALVAPVALSASFNASSADLARASNPFPRPHFKGAPSLAHANLVLNGHLSRAHPDNTKPCESFSADQLSDLAALLFQEADAAMLQIYRLAGDNRRERFESLQELQSELSELILMAKDKPELEHVLRDGLCHRVVMGFIHHLPSDKQAEMAQLGLELPLLPEATHTHQVVPKDAASQAVHKAYDSSITCQKCHVGGINDLGVNEVKPTTAKQLARRCYTNYKELFNVSCGPCDGIAGRYWGDDDDKYFTADACSVVGTPEQIPEAERVKAAFPEQFAVEVAAGSDRWGRTTNPAGHVKTPFPPVIDSMYGQITGKWFVDITPDSDLWMLRHDTTYSKVALNGTFIPLLHFQVSEIHGQTRKQQSMNNTGQMVSLISGIPNFVPGGCTCIADPVGVPDVHHERTTGLDEMEYLGRINITLSEFDGSIVTVDHWANWFFHVFMELDTSLPYYGKAPKRLASAYAGTAVYKNWVLADPKIADPTVWNRGIPTSPERVGPSKGQYCLNPTKIDMCNNISQSTWPPAPERAAQQAQEPKAVDWRAIHKHFLPSLDHLMKS